MTSSNAGADQKMSNTAMLSSEKPSTEVADRLKTKNEKPPLEKKFNSIDLGLILVASLPKSTVSKLRSAAKKL